MTIIHLLQNTKVHCNINKEISKLQIFNNILRIDNKSKIYRYY